MWPEIQLPSTIEETTGNPAIRSEMESGMVLTRARYTRTRRIWTLTWANLRGGNYRTLRNFYVAKKGGSLIFTWTHPIENITFNVRFDGDLIATHTERDCWNVSIQLEEV